MSLPIVRIQRHCLHDGPGIRTTVFLQGCALACPWCSNPEAIPLTPPAFFDEQKCIAHIQADAPLCAGCPFPESGAAPRTCPLGAVHPASSPVEQDAVLQHLMKDAALYRDSNGGVTFSGGEPFLHARALRPLLEALREEGIHIAFETSGFFPPEQAPILLPFINHLLLDLKWMTTPVFNPEISLPPDVFEQNLAAFQVAAAEMTYRLVLIREFLDVPGKRESLLARLQELPPAPIELLPLHHLAESKYRQLGIPFTPLSAPTRSDQKAFCSQIKTLTDAPVRLLRL
ncbi:MAG: glycyl-radical enzyme activating protein [Kiritimatiellae bacterium]|nr:glycyl-radical enzyme activating protein [Kiritimatiellia bacterium]MDD4341321.1 glycyl-radical enzyme activating protein [Kiritimatiellia bacterium]